MERGEGMVVGGIRGGESVKTSLGFLLCIQSDIERATLGTIQAYVI